MSEKDDKDKDDDGGGLGDEASKLISSFGDEVDKRVNKILDERLRVNEDKSTDDKSDDDKSDDDKSDDDNPPAPKTLAERLGF